MRRKLVVGNWKMNGSRESSINLVKSIVSQYDDASAVDMAICAPFVYLNDVAKELEGNFRVEF